MLIPRKEPSVHYYTREGEPFYEVEKKDGTGKRPVTIKDARAKGALPSVTTVMKILAKEGLVNWRIEQAILSALTLPRRVDENEHDFAKRALADSEAQAADAASKGTAIHDAAAEWLMHGRLPGPEMAALLAPFQAWAAQNITRTIYSEKVITNAAQGYAGRLDAFVELKVGGYAIMDLKTQDVKKDKKGFAKCEFYDEWAIQLAAYAACEQLQFWTPSNHRLMSVVIGRNEPFLEVQEWGGSAQHLNCFLHAARVWHHLKDYDPTLGLVA